MLTELEQIEAKPNLLNDAPRSFLNSMLSDWMQWAPGDSRGSEDYATLEGLRVAVDKAGFGKVAQDLVL